MRRWRRLRDGWIEFAGLEIWRIGTNARIVWKLFWRLWINWSLPSNAGRFLAIKEYTIWKRCMYLTKRRALKITSRIVQWDVKYCHEFLQMRVRCGAWGVSSHYSTCTSDWLVPVSDENKVSGWRTAASNLWGTWRNNKRRNSPKLFIVPLDRRQNGTDTITSVNGRYTTTKTGRSVQITKLCSSQDW